MINIFKKRKGNKLCDDKLVELVEAIMLFECSEKNTMDQQKLLSHYYGSLVYLPVLTIGIFSSYLKKNAFVEGKLAEHSVTTAIIDSNALPLKEDTND